MAFDPKRIQRAVSITLNGLSAHRSSVLLISTLLMLSWFIFKSGPDSFMSKHPGVIFVLLGVVGVVVLDFKKIKTRRGLVRFIFDALLIVGLILELREASKSDVEVSRLNAIAMTASNDSARAIEKTATLQVELERIKAPRHIAADKRKAFIESLQNIQRGPVDLGARHPDGETSDYMREVKSLLNDAGYKIVNSMNYPDDVSAMNANSDIGIFIDTISNAPTYWRPLLNAFRAAGRNPTVFTNDNSYEKTDLECIGASNRVLILVTEKYQ